MARLYSQHEEIFYGVKVQLLTTGTGIPIAFCFTPCKEADIKSMERIIQAITPENQHLCK